MAAPRAVIAEIASFLRTQPTRGAAPWPPKALQVAPKFAVEVAFRPEPIGAPPRTRLSLKPSILESIVRRAGRRGLQPLPVA